MVAAGPQFELSAPSTSTEIQAAVTPAAPITPAQVVREIRSGGGAGPDEGAALAALLMVPLLPVTTVVAAPVQLLLRGPLGSLAGMPPEERNRAMAAIASAAAGLQFADNLQTSVLARTHSRHPDGIVPAPPGKTAGNAPPAATMLQLEVFGPALNAARGGSHAHRLEVDVSVRILSAGDGRERYYDYLMYRGDAKPYADWAKEDGAPLTAEFHRAVATLAEEIVQQIFVRTEVAADETERLAALGLSRRSGGPALFPNAPAAPAPYHPPPPPMLERGRGR
jgi:hypothetical protein